MSEPLPAALALRPVDEKRKLPIPLANTFPDGEHDFTVLNGEVAFTAGRERRCGICGTGLGPHVAFLGGPRAAVARTYSDPPMHPECAEASTRLCPHIARAPMSRAPEGKNVRSPKGDSAETPDGWVEKKPGAWVMLVCLTYRIQLIPAGGGGHHALFLVDAQHIVECRVYEYGEDGQLQYARTTRPEH